MVKRRINFDKSKSLITTSMNFFLSEILPLDKLEEIQ